MVTVHENIDNERGKKKNHRTESQKRGRKNIVNEPKRRRIMRRTRKLTQLRI